MRLGLLLLIGLAGCAHPKPLATVIDVATPAPEPPFDGPVPVRPTSIPEGLNCRLDGAYDGFYVIANGSSFSITDARQHTYTAKCVDGQLQETGHAAWPTRDPIAK